MACFAADLQYPPFCKAQHLPRIDELSFPARKTIGRYEICSQLGAGGMGEVYLAHDTKLDRKVAFKILPADVIADKTGDRARRFVQEAKAASALNHPNILTIYEIDEVDSAPFIATEYVDGETLRDRIKSGSLKPAAQLISVRDGYHLWAERFDRLVEDILDLQNEVSQKIVEALKVSLSDSERALLTQKPTDDLRAFCCDALMRSALERWPIGPGLTTRFTECAKIKNFSNY